jgi:zinc transport system substrate-binding protein
MITRLQTQDFRLRTFVCGLRSVVYCLTSDTKLAVLLSALVCCLLPFSCKKENSSVAQGNKIKVAATIFPLADIIKNIGSDKVTVITIMPPGASPHTFEVSPKTVESAMGSGIFFKIGAGLDDWVEGVTGAMEKKPEIVDISKFVKLRKLPDGTTDPHYWLSPENGMVIAKVIAESLSTIDPSGKELYSKNLAGYLKLLSNANEELKKMFVNLRDKKFVTFHEAWFYFAAAYGLDVVAAFEPFPGKEPTPDFIVRFTKIIKENNIKVLFTEPQFSADVVRQLAKDIGIKLEVLDPIGGTSAQTDSYISMIKTNADIIYNTLSKK